MATEPVALRALLSSTRLHLDLLKAKGAKGPGDQPRHPAGSPLGGQFKGTGGASGGSLASKMMSLFGFVPKGEAPQGVTSSPAHASSYVPPEPLHTKPHTKSAVLHPAKGDRGEAVYVQRPTQASDPKTWTNPAAVATFVPGGPAPTSLNGVSMKPWQPGKDFDWTKAPGQNAVVEAGLPDITKHQFKHAAAGVIIQEPDGRIWLTRPTNGFGGYQNTFPKGTQENGLSLQQTAIKEAWEETGLKIEITGVLGDFERTTSIARYYVAKRVGGSPSGQGWESQALRLSPPGAMKKLLNMPVDKEIADMIDWERRIAKTRPYLDPAQVEALLARTEALIDKAKGAGGGKGGESGGKAGHWQNQPRWPSGTPLGGQWKAYDGEGVPTPPSIGTATNKGQYLKAKAAYDALKAGQIDKVHDHLKGLDQALSIKGILPSAAGVYPKHGNSQQKWTQQAHQYVTDLVHGIGAKTGIEAKVDKLAGPLLLSSLKKIGVKPGGSNPGAVYHDPASGKSLLVKGANTASDDRAKNEVLAAKLMTIAGIGAPEMQLVDLQGAHGGGLGVAAEMVKMEGWSIHNPQHLEKAQSEFAVHAWLANYDAVGLPAGDNLAMKGGAVFNYDPGGALLYRAQGKPKFASGSLPHTPSEWTSMRDKGVNAAAHSVYGSMTKAQLQASAQKLAGITDAQIKTLVTTYGPGDAKAKDALAKALIARRNNILVMAGLAKGGVAVPLAGATAPAPQIAPVAAPVAQETPKVVAGGTGGAQPAAAPASTGPFHTHYATNTDEGHSKFYRVDVVVNSQGGFTVLKTWGKIGAAGQTQLVGSYGTKEAAMNAAQMTMGPKLNKGYVTTTVPGGALPEKVAQAGYGAAAPATPILTAIPVPDKAPAGFKAYTKADGSLAVSYASTGQLFPASDQTPASAWLDAAVVVAGWHANGQLETLKSGMDAYATGNSTGMAALTEFTGKLVADLEGKTAVAPVAAPITSGGPGTFKGPATTNEIGAVPQLKFTGIPGTKGLGNKLWAKGYQAKAALMAGDLNKLNTAYADMTALKQSFPFGSKARAKIAGQQAWVVDAASKLGLKIEGGKFSVPAGLAAEAAKPKMLASGVTDAFANAQAKQMLEDATGFIDSNLVTPLGQKTQAAVTAFHNNDDKTMATVMGQIALTGYTSSEALYDKLAELAGTKPGVFPLATGGQTTSAASSSMPASLQTDDWKGFVGQFQTKLNNGDLASAKDMVAGQVKYLQQYPNDDDNQSTKDFVRWANGEIAAKGGDPVDTSGLYTSGVSKPAHDAAAVTPSPATAPVTTVPVIPPKPPKPVFKEGIGKTTVPYYDGLVAKMDAAYDKGDMAALVAAGKKPGGSPAWPVALKDGVTPKTANAKIAEAYHSKLVEQLKPVLAAKNEADMTAPVAVPAPGANVGNLPAMPRFNAVKLDPSKSNAPSHNAKVDTIAGLAAKGDVKGILALNYGTNTYGKQQAKLANSALAALGSPFTVDIGQKKHSHPALTGGVTAAAAVKSAALTDKELPPKLSFTNWQGQGKGLSSSDVVNKANQDAYDKLTELAKAGDFNAVKNFTFQPVDKTTGQPSGAVKGIGDHPSQHVKGHWEYLVQTMDEKLNPPKPLEIFEAKQAAKSIAALSGKFPPKPLGITSKKVPSSQAIGHYIAIGQVTGADHLVPAKQHDFTPQQTAQGKADFALWQHDSKAQAFRSAVQGHGGHEYHGGWDKPTDTAHGSYGSKHTGQTLIDRAKAAHKWARKQPPGTKIYKWENLSPDMKMKLEKAQPGLIIQNPAPTCASRSPTATKGFGSGHRWNIIFTEGAKGLNSYGSGSHPGEQEVTLLPNHRFMIVSHKKGTLGQPAETTVLLLPPDPALDSDGYTSGYGYDPKG